MGHLDVAAAQAISQRIAVAPGSGPTSGAAPSTPSVAAEGATRDVAAAAAAAVAGEPPPHAAGEHQRPWSLAVQWLRQGGAVLQRIPATAGALGSSLAGRLQGRGGVLGPPGGAAVQLGGVVQRHLRELDTFQLPNQTNRLALAFSPLEGFPFLAGLEVFEAQHRTAPHVHEAAFELFFIVSGARPGTERLGFRV